MSQRSGNPSTIFKTPTRSPSATPEPRATGASTEHMGSSDDERKRKHKHKKKDHKEHKDDKSHKRHKRVPTVQSRLVQACMCPCWRC